MMAFVVCCGITCTIQSFFRELRRRLFACRPNLRPSPRPWAKSDRGAIALLIYIFFIRKIANEGANVAPK
jgi:hypothetical protein